MRRAGPIDAAAFNVEMTPVLERLEGEWVPVQLVTDSKPLKDEWLAFGTRTAVGNEVKVVFGGQVVVHAKMRIDESATSTAVDYLHLRGTHAGGRQPRHHEWIGDDVRVLMADAGEPGRLISVPSHGHAQSVAAPVVVRRSGDT